MSAFGLTETQATHQPWDMFSSAESAAIAFSLMHTRHATNINREIGAMIYAVNTGIINRGRHYTFGIPWIGMEYNVIAGFIQRNLIGDVGMPLRSNIVALAHTHPAGINWFSPADMNIAHGRYNILGIGVPAMPVFMSVFYRGNLEVRQYTSDMDRFARGRRIFIR